MLQKNKCPFGDDIVQYVYFPNGKSFVFCYICQHKYFKKDYKKTKDLKKIEVIE